jgi:hypothetical protein
MALLTDEGRYPAKITAAELGESANTGTGYLQLSFETENGEGHIAKRLYVSDKAFPYTLKTLQDVFAFDGDFTNLDQLVGKSCSITTAMESDDSGNDRLQVRWINRAGGPKLEPEKAGSLAARLNAMAKSAPVKAKTETEEEIPF